MSILSMCMSVRMSVSVLSVCLSVHVSVYVCVQNGQVTHGADWAVFCHQLLQRHYRLGTWICAARFLHTTPGTSLQQVLTHTQRDRHRQTDTQTDTHTITLTFADTCTIVLTLSTTAVSLASLGTWICAART